jgi:glycosyltransferase involved in cell wall biosynthesis
VRVLHLTDHYLPVLGGIETHVAALADRQVRRGDDVSVLTSTPADADGQHLDDHGPVAVRRARSLLEGVSVDVTRFDVVHAHLSVVAPFSAPLAALAARRGVPTLVTVHSLWNGMGPVPEAAARVSGLRSAPVLWSAVSRVAAAQLAQRVPPHAPVRVLPNAVEVTPRALTPTPRPGGPVRLVSTMRVARRKRPLELVRMFDALRRSVDVPVELTIVGDGPLRPRVERRLRQLGLDGAVRVTGRVEPATVLEILARSDVYVAPAVLESFGLAALEARCVGLPVVGHAASGMTDFLQDRVEGMLCPDDSTMVRRLAELVSDPALRHRMSEHNRTVPSRMSWDNTLSHHDAAYDEVTWVRRTRRTRSLSPAGGRSRS